jgi:hypothetical protein
MPSPKTPKPPSPEEAARAAVMATQAGDIYQMVNAPLTGYADLYSQAMMGPARMQLQQGLAAQGGLQAAQAQEDIQSRVDPMAYAIRQMNLKSSSSRLGQLYGMDPSKFSYRSPAAYSIPSNAQMPNISNINALSNVLASNVSRVNLGRGGQTSVTSPTNPQTMPNVLLSPSGNAFAGGTLPSYLGVV